MKTSKFVMAFMAIGMLMMVAVAVTAVAEEQTIGNIGAYTPGYQEEADKMYYAVYYPLEGKGQWSVEWKYNTPIEGTITNIQIRGRPAGGSGPTAYQLKINGVSVGKPDSNMAISNGVGPATTKYCWTWENIDVAVDGKVLFEFGGLSSSVRAYVYAGRGGAGIGLDVDNDGDKCAAISLVSPNGYLSDGCKIVKEYTNLHYKQVASDIIYEFTFDDTVVEDTTPDDSSGDTNDTSGDSTNDSSDQTDEQEPTTPVETNEKPNEPQIEYPVDETTDVDPNEEMKMKVLVSDPDGDDMDVSFYIKKSSEDTWGTPLQETRSSSGAVLCFYNDMEYETTYDWYVEARERTPELLAETSDVASFTTMEEPNIPPAPPTELTENALPNDTEINVGDIFELGVPVEDTDGDELIVTFYLKNGATRAIGNVSISGSGDAAIEVNSSGLPYNESFVWWATVDDGENEVKTEERTFSTAKAPVEPKEPETDDEGNWFWLVWIPAIIGCYLIIRGLIVWYRAGKFGNALQWIRRKFNRAKKAISGKAAKKRGQTKRRAAGNKKKAAKKSTKKQTSAIAKVKQTGTKVKTFAKTKMHKVVVFGRFVKESFVLGYYAATADVSMKNESHVRGKCTKCGKEDFFEEKEVFGKTRYYCKHCGTWQRNLEVTVETPKDKLLASKTKNVNA